MTGVEWAVSLKLLLMFFGGFVLGFVAGCEYACSDWNEP